jgi:hypothetical protein
LRGEGCGIGIERGVKDRQLITVSVRFLLAPSPRYRACAVECAEGVDPFSCDCLTQSGETLTFYPSAFECFLG